jgi:hypothetical protein
MTVGSGHLLMEPGHTAHDRARPVAAAAESAARSALPVVAGFCSRLKLRDIVDAACPVRDLAELTHGQVIGALVASRLTSPPLVHVQSWARDWAVGEALGVEPELLNDDRIGRALDAIAPHLDQIAGSAGVAAIEAFGIDVTCSARAAGESPPRSPSSAWPAHLLPDRTPGEAQPRRTRQDHGGGPVRRAARHPHRGAHPRHPRHRENHPRDRSRPAGHPPADTLQLRLLDLLGIDPRQLR